MSNVSLSFKLRLSLIIVIGVALLKTGTWWWLSIYALSAISWSIYLQTPLKSLTKLLGSELILLSLLCLPLGWEKASFLLLRSLLCLLTMNSFLLTLPSHSFAIALSSLPLPSDWQEIVILAGQYLEILLSEVLQMQRSAKLRGLIGTSGWFRYVSAAMIGSLYLRSLARAERVYEAMLVRGYHGKLSLESKLTTTESFLLIIVAMLITIFSLSSYVDTGNWGMGALLKSTSIRIPNPLVLINKFFSNS